jgi:hypothetical protein
MTQHPEHVMKYALEVAREWDRIDWNSYEGDFVADLADDIAAALTAAFAAMPGPEVKVKQLEFVEEVPNWFVARALGSTYEVRLTDRGNVRVRNPIGRKWEYFHGEIQDALRAMNSDYKARILSALTPAPDLASENERLRVALEAAKKVVDVAEHMTSCRSDDEFVWDAQKKINAALDRT